MSQRAGDVLDWGNQSRFDAVNACMFSAIDMIRGRLDGRTGRRVSHIVNVTSLAIMVPVPRFRR